MSAPTPNRPAPHSGGGAAPGQAELAVQHRRRAGVPNWSLSAQQRRVLATEGLTYLGTDARERPVVEGLVGIPQQARTWAVLRSGDPADVVQPVSLVQREQQELAELVCTHVPDDPNGIVLQEAPAARCPSCGQASTPERGPGSPQSIRHTDGCPTDRLDRLLTRMSDLADALDGPLECTHPAYGAPGVAHCAACCYGTGRVITSPGEQAMADTADQLRRAAVAIKAEMA